MTHRIIFKTASGETVAEVAWSFVPAVGDGLVLVGKKWRVDAVEWEDGNACLTVIERVELGGG